MKGGDTLGSPLHWPLPLPSDATNECWFNCRMLCICVVTPPCSTSLQAHLKEWMGLDDARVVPELIAQLEAAAADLCDRWGEAMWHGPHCSLNSTSPHRDALFTYFYFLCRSMDAHLDGLVETMDALQPDDLLACLDVMGEGATEEAGAAGAEVVPKS